MSEQVFSSCFFIFVDCLQHSLLVVPHHVLVFSLQSACQYLYLCNSPLRKHLAYHGELQAEYFNSLEESKLFLLGERLTLFLADWRFGYGFVSISVDKFAKCFFIFAHFIFNISWS